MACLGCAVLAPGWPGRPNRPDFTERLLQWHLCRDPWLGTGRGAPAPTTTLDLSWIMIIRQPLSGAGLCCEREGRSTQLRDRARCSDDCPTVGSTGGDDPLCDPSRNSSCVCGIGLTSEWDRWHLLRWPSPPPTDSLRESHHTVRSAATSCRSGGSRGAGRDTLVSSSSRVPGRFRLRPVLRCPRRSTEWQPAWRLIKR